LSAAGITVIVCTRNRPARLRAFLEAACDLACPADLTWELLVVDNGEGGAARSIAEGFAGRLPVRCVTEARPGLSHARNRGVAEARGRYLCWTDDDVRPDPDWLAAYAQAFASRPGAALFAGRVLPELEPPSPSWFAAARRRWPLTSVLAHRDFGDQSLPLSAARGRLPYGANYAVRADVQRRFTYDPELGVAPGRERVGEETDLAFRILGAGHTGWWVPASSVRHVIPAERQSADYVLSYFRGVGATAAYLHQVRPGDNAGEVKRPPPFAHISTAALQVIIAVNALGALQVIIAVNALGFALARRLGLTGVGLGLLARQGYYEGVANHRCRGIAVRGPVPASRAEPAR
jgi:glucosyl-dolichyl phosphate glucuronosyltransferase